MNRWLSTPASGFASGLSLFLPAILLYICALSAPANAAAIPINKEQSGSLPKSGSIALRSGLEWMDETSPLFMEIKATVEPLLSARGLTVEQPEPSALSPLPRELTAGAQKSKNTAAQSTTPQILQFARSQQEGTPVMFRGGRIPGRIPAELASQDAANLDYVILCRVAGVSPGYISMTDGAGYSAEAELVRHMMENPVFTGKPDDFITAAGTVQGVGTLGYGTSAPATPPRSGYGSTPGDYARGYEGNSPVPGDPWNREADLRARDYQQKNSPPPQIATPPGPSAPSVKPPVTEPAPLPSLPKPPLPGDTDMPAVSPGPAASRPAPTPVTEPQSGVGVLPDAAPANPPTPVNLPASSLKPPQTKPAAAANATPAIPRTSPDKSKQKYAIAGYALELECYDLRPVKAGKKAKVVWACTVQQRADKPSLSAALPDMLRVALGLKAAK